ncbi:unnamed protein product [Closterium sp. NIES-54]
MTWRERSAKAGGSPTAFWHCGGAAGARGVGATTTGGTGAASAGGPAGTGGTGPANALCHLLGLPPAPTEFLVAGTTPSLLFPQLLPHSPLPAPAPYTAVTESLTERREPETRASTLERREPKTHASTPERRELETRASVRARVPRVRRSRAPAIPGTHDMTLHPSSVPQRVVLPSPPASSLPAVADPSSDLARASSPTVTRFLATVVTDPTLSSPAASALVTEIVDFAAAYRLDYLASLVSDPDLADKIRRKKRKSTGTYVDEVPPPGANIVSGMWIFRVKRPPGSPPAFKARYVARGFNQHDGVDFFHTFSPNPKMTTLRVLLHVAAQRDCELHSLDFSTDFLQGSLHQAIWLRRPPGFTGLFPEGTQWSLQRPVYGLRQAPREWHDTLRTTLAALGFAPSTVDPSLFLRTDTTLPPFYVMLQERHTCTDLGPSELRLPVLLATAHSSVYRPLALSSTFGRVRRAEWSVPRACGLPHAHWDAAKRVLRYLYSTSGMGLVLGGQGSVVLTGHSDASWADDQATQRLSQGYTFSLGFGSVSWRSTRSSSMLGSSCLLAWGSGLGFESRCMHMQAVAAVPSLLAWGLYLPATFNEWLSEPDTPKAPDVFIQAPLPASWWGQPEACTWDESAVGADDDVAADKQYSGDNDGVGDCEAGAEEDVFPDRGATVEDDDGVEC